MNENRPYRPPGLHGSNGFFWFLVIALLVACIICVFGWIAFNRLLDAIVAHWDIIYKNGGGK